MNVKTKGKAGGLAVNNHAQAAAVVVKTSIKAGRLSANTNQALARPAPK